MVITQQSTSATTSDPKLVMYENETEIGRNENPPEWWRVNKSKYPRISTMAYRYLCIAATSAPSERIFSASGHLTSDKRSRLTPDNANLLLSLIKNRWTTDLRFYLQYFFFFCGYIPVLFKWMSIDVHCNCDQMGLYPMPETLRWVLGDDEDVFADDWSL